MSLQTTRAALLAKLNTLTTLKSVVDYEANELTTYPAATLTLAGGAGEWSGRNYTKRTRRFKVIVFIEREQYTEKEAEDILVSVIDELETALDTDITLGGAVKWVGASSWEAGYMAREVDCRAGTITIEAHEIVQV